MHLLDRNSFEATGGLTLGQRGAGDAYRFVLLREMPGKRCQFPEDPRFPGAVPARCTQHLGDLGSDWKKACAVLNNPALQLPDADKARGIFVPGYKRGESLNPSQHPDMTAVLSDKIPFGPWKDHSLVTAMKSNPGYIFAIAEGFHADLEKKHSRWLGFLRCELDAPLIQRAQARAKDPEAAHAQELRYFNRKRTAPVAGWLRYLSHEPGDFKHQMAGKLDAGESLDSFSPKAQESVRDIFIKASIQVSDPKDPRYQAAAAAFNRDFFQHDPTAPRMAEPTRRAEDVDRAARIAAAAPKLVAPDNADPW